MGNTVFSDIKEMTTDQKLDLLDELWEDLYLHASDIPSPDWHRDELEARHNAVKEGTVRYMTLDELEARLFKRA